MKIEKISAHHIRFDNGTAIKIAPQSMRIDTTSLSLVPNIKDMEFKEPVAFTEGAQGFQLRQYRRQDDTRQHLRRRCKLRVRRLL